MKHTCNYCGATFHIVDRFPAAREVSRCGEPACRLRMGSAKMRGPAIRMEVEAQDLEGRTS